MCKQKHYIFLIYIIVNVYKPLINAVNSAEKVVITLWEDFRDLLGVGEAVRRVTCCRLTDGRTRSTICTTDGTGLDSQFVLCSFKGVFCLAGK